MNKLTGILAAGILCAGLIMNAPDARAQPRERAEAPEAYTWQLEDLYPNDAAWRKAKDELAASMDQILQYQGKLTESPEALLACLAFDSRLGKEFKRLLSYANMKSDLDTRDADNMSMKQEIQQIGTNYGTKASFIDPELVKLDEATIDRFIREEPGLEVYRFALMDILRRKTHKLSAEEEKIIAEAGLMSGGPADIYNIFANAELPYPEVTLSDGSKVRLNQAGYGLHRASPVRQDREQVFREFWGAMNRFRQTLGVSLYSKIKGDVFYARVRGYDSSLEAKLDQNNIPVEVYHALIQNVNDNLDSFHRYLKIKKRMLGVDTLKYSDLYAPTVKNVELKYTYEEARDLVLKAFAPMGEDYVATVRKALENRWIDVYPTPGKRAGAYSNGSAYDVHPYILLNFNGTYSDVSTLAHELGHTMHSHLSNTHQPYPLAGYSIFVAEVASTLNEALLKDAMLKTIKDDDIRLSLLMQYLDGIKGTLFRQTQFAEFELRMHEIAEKDRPLTGDNLTALYGDILKRYYGHDRGVTHIEDRVTVEWAFIPHFYYNFYVYQYATSFTASTALAERVLAGEKGAIEDVMGFLTAGGSKYPIDILKDAGVDMTGSEPFDKTMQAMNRTMDEIETILNKKGI